MTTPMDKLVEALAAEMLAERLDSTREVAAAHLAAVSEGARDLYRAEARREFARLERVSGLPLTDLVEGRATVVRAVTSAPPYSEEDRALILEIAAGFAASVTNSTPVEGSQS